METIVIENENSARLNIEASYADYTMLLRQSRDIIVLCPTQIKQLKDFLNQLEL